MQQENYSSSSSIFFTIFMFLFFSTSSQATIVTINSQHFHDREMSTLDLATNLEWFDLTTTKNRTFDDVYYDLTHEGGTFDPADGWRYANEHEVRDLISRVFAPGYIKEYREIPGQDEAVANFVNLLGDSWTDLVSTNFLITRDLDTPFSVGRSNGIFAVETAHGTKVGGFADVNDNQYIIYDRTDPDGIHFDLTDYIWISVTQSTDETNYESYTNSHLASWIVRNTANIPEPSAVILLLLGGLGLCLRRPC